MHFRMKNQKKEIYPLNAATQRGASPNSFKWFGSSPRVANSFTMSVYLKIFGKYCNSPQCHLLPLAVVLFAKYGLYGRVEDKLVLSRTFGTARLENPESKLDTTQIITRLIWWLAIAWWWWWRRVRSMNMRWCLITTSDNNCENSHDNPADNLQAVNQSSLKWKWKWK